MSASRIARVCLVLLTPLVLITPARAGTHDGNAKILLHARSVVAKNICASGEIATCQEAVTQGALNTYYNVFVLVARGNLPHIAGLQFGIDYPGGVNINGGETPITVFSWTLCAWIELVSPSPLWPAPGGGTIILWDDDDPCRTGEMHVAGYFYMGAYETSYMRIIPRPIDQALKVSRCDNTEVILDAPDDAGYAAFSDTGALGCNPCDASCFVVAVEPSSWSRIKAHGGS
jgi:hypothetical protein